MPSMGLGLNSFRAPRDSASHRRNEHLAFTARIRDSEYDDACPPSFLGSRRGTRLISWPKSREHCFFVPQFGLQRNLLHDKFPPYSYWQIVKCINTSVLFLFS